MEADDDNGADAMQKAGGATAAEDDTVVAEGGQPEAAAAAAVAEPVSLFQKFIGAFSPARVRRPAKTVEGRPVTDSGGPPPKALTPAKRPVGNKAAAQFKNPTAGARPVTGHRLNKEIDPNPPKKIRPAAVRGGDSDVVVDQPVIDEASPPPGVVDVAAVAIIPARGEAPGVVSEHPPAADAVVPTAVSNWATAMAALESGAGAGIATPQGVVTVSGAAAEMKQPQPEGASASKRPRGNNRVVKPEPRPASPLGPAAAPIPFNLPPPEPIVSDPHEEKRRAPTAAQRAAAELERLDQQLHGVKYESMPMGEFMLNAADAKLATEYLDAWPDDTGRNDPDLDVYQRAFITMDLFVHTAKFVKDVLAIPDLNLQRRVLCRVYALCVLQPSRLAYAITVCDTWCRATYDNMGLAGADPRTLFAAAGVPSALDAKINDALAPFDPEGVLKTATRGAAGCIGTLKKTSKGGEPDRVIRVLTDCATSLVKECDGCTKEIRDAEERARRVAQTLRTTWERARKARVAAMQANTNAALVADNTVRDSMPKDFERRLQLISVLNEIYQNTSSRKGVSHGYQREHLSALLRHELHAAYDDFKAIPAFPARDAIATRLENIRRQWHALQTYMPLRTLSTYDATIKDLPGPRPVVQRLWGWVHAAADAKKRAEAESQDGVVKVGRREFYNAVVAVTREVADALLEHVDARIEVETTRIGKQTRAKDQEATTHAALRDLGVEKAGIEAAYTAFKGVHGAASRPPPSAPAPLSEPSAPAPLSAEVLAALNTGGDRQVVYARVQDAWRTNDIRTDTERLKAEARWIEAQAHDDVRNLADLNAELQRVNARYIDTMRTRGMDPVPPEPAVLARHLDADLDRVKGARKDAAAVHTQWLAARASHPGADEFTGIDDAASVCIQNLLETHALCKAIAKSRADLVEKIERINLTAAASSPASDAAAGMAMEVEEHKAITVKGPVVTPVKRDSVERAIQSLARISEGYRHDLNEWKSTLDVQAKQTIDTKKRNDTLAYQRVALKRLDDRYRAEMGEMGFTNVCAPRVQERALRAASASLATKVKELKEGKARWKTAASIHRKHLHAERAATTDQTATVDGDDDDEKSAWNRMESVLERIAELEANLDSAAGCAVVAHKDREKIQEVIRRNTDLPADSSSMHVDQDDDRGFEKGNPAGTFFVQHAAVMADATNILVYGNSRTDALEKANDANAVKKPKGGSGKAPPVATVATTAAGRSGGGGGSGGALIKSTLEATSSVSVAVLLLAMMNVSGADVGRASAATPSDAFTGASARASLRAHLCA